MAARKARKTTRSAGGKKKARAATRKTKASRTATRTTRGKAKTKPRRRKGADDVQGYIYTGATPIQQSTLFRPATTRELAGHNKLILRSPFGR